MAGDVPPPSPDGSPAPRRRRELEFAPYVPPPALAASTTVAVAEATPPIRVRPRIARFRQRLTTTPVLVSLLIHTVLFILVWLLWPAIHGPPEEPVVRANLVDWHWIGNDPESEGSGPKGPVADKPPDAEPKGKEVAPGFLDDDRIDQGTVKVAGGDKGAAAGSAFAGRLDGKEGLVAAGGGDGGTEGAVHLALDFLARHQEADGTWNARRYPARCLGPGCTGECEEEYVSATTALALLPFLGAGHTHKSGPWQDVVRRGLTALRDRQRPDGSFDDGAKHGYADALSLLAIAEAYGLTRNKDLAAVARKGVAYFVARQSASGGWRYEPGDGQADSSVTCWAAMALAASRKAGIDVPDTTLARCRDWFADHTDETGALGYTSAGNGTRSMISAGFFVPLMLDERPDGPRLLAAASRLDSSLPRWPESASAPGVDFGVADPLQWYYGGLAAFQRGGGTWKVWNERLKPLLVDHQEHRGCPAGSWAPVGATGRKGGRLVATALCALSLEVYYRYPRVTALR
jgi:hypothetical protein